MNIAVWILERDNKMKTLVNKNNPQIRITAPEIEVQEESEMYLIPVSDYCIPMCIDDWTLVEEEPEKLHIDKSRGYNLASEDATANGFNQPKEPVDLEEEIRKYLEPITYADIRIEPFNSLEKCARHFYELGRKGGSK